MNVTSMAFVAVAPPLGGVGDPIFDGQHAVLIETAGRAGWELAEYLPGLPGTPNRTWGTRLGNISVPPVRPMGQN
jgi:hypothetical protein